MIPIDGEPGEIRYEVAVDERWRTTKGSINLGEKTINIAVSDGKWQIDGEENHELTGCIDVDLGWTPSTNTVAIKRLALEVGETAETRSAWLRFPEMEFTPSIQNYTRVSNTHWRYHSATADYDLEVSPDGVVCRYGDLWWGSVETGITPGTS
jgi:hypothetical protein